MRNHKKKRRDVRNTKKSSKSSKQSSKKSFGKINFIVLLIIVLLLIILGLFFKFYYPLCENEECFSDSLIKCSKAGYYSETSDTTIFYKILGKEKDKCQVFVQLKTVKQGSIELLALEEKTMICDIPLKTYIKPEQNIKNCHGELREEVQEIMIQRMHSQILENIGDISKEISQVI